MEKSKKNGIILSVISLVFVLCLISGLDFDTKEHLKNDFYDFTLVSDDTKKIEIIKIVFSSDFIPQDATMASSLRSLLWKNYGVNASVSPDSEKTKEFEILLGQTNRPESSEFFSIVEAACVNPDDLAWGYAVINGKLLYLANSNEAYMRGEEEFTEYVTENNFILPSDLLVVKTLTMAEYEEELRQKEEQNKQEYIDSLREMNEQFTDSQFNTDKYMGEFYKPMIDENGNGWFLTTKNGEPWAYPAEGEHPRYLLTKDNIPKIKAILEEGKNVNSDYYDLAKTFWELANTDMESIHYGVFQNQYKNTGANSWLEPTGEPYRYDGETLGIIDAKAMAYLITGDVRYAYEAIIAIKNAMLSLHYTTDLHQDVYHGPSHVMVTLAAVYDWCYDALTETDKWQLIWGTAQILGPQMEKEMQYPPSGMQPINGHGIGPQLSRDWMSVATVFYDEVPDWYRYVAGRYFNEYIPVANEQFKSGWVAQGTTTYGTLKLHMQAWAAYLIKTSTGENFFTEDMAKTAYYLISHITPYETDNAWQQYYFQTGDGAKSRDGTQVGFAEYFVIAALYNDSVIYAQAKLSSDNHKRFDYGSIFTMTPSFQLALASAVDYNGEDARDGIETIQYFGNPAGQITIREEWDNPNSVAIFMNLHNLTMAGHEGYDHGTFQIYYKGLLAGTSGSYKKYGSDAHYYYLQATIAHNGLLVFNPSMADTEPGKAERYLYSGSQRRAEVGVSSVDAWLESATMVETLGAAYGYSDDGSAKYAYLAGDLTNAYDAQTVDFVGRRMFTLFTGDEDFPALFFTFDQITSDDVDFTKHWLLHTINEPEIDQDNLTATIINGDGKMYLESLYGANSIMKIGGDGKAFWINGYFTDSSNKGSWDEKLQDFTDPANKGSWVEGKNATDEYAINDDAENIWGRIELRTDGSKFSNFFTVMAVTDTANETPFEITKFKTEDGSVYGAQYNNSIIAFLNSADNPAEKNYKEFSFTTEGKGLYEYYISGVEAGTWQVFVDGVSVAFAFADSEESLLTFTAPAGNIVFKPGADVIGANGGKIEYVTGGAILPKDTLYAYTNEADFTLPTMATRGDDVFVGWYTSPTYEPETAIEFIPAGTSGTVRVYAKWLSNFVNEDYTNVNINHRESNEVYKDVTYRANNKNGASFITKVDENGVSYLEWIEGEKDPFIYQTSKTKNFSMIASDDKCVSLTFKLATNPDSTPMATSLQLRATQDVTGEQISSTVTYIFQTKTDGTVVSNKGMVIAKLTEEVSTIRVVIDFKNGEMRYYDDEYSVITTGKFSPPSATKANNTEEFLKCLTEYLWYFHADTSNDITDAAMRVYGIRVQEGDEFTPLYKPQTEGIIYNTGGAKLPNDALKDFNSDGTPTPLPADMTLDGYVFDGWYTSPTYEPETTTTAAPAGTEGFYEVWAKWKRIFVDEDFSDADIDYTEDSKDYNGIRYGGYNKTGSSYKTVTENGNKYLVWTPGTKDSQIYVQNADINISTMHENSISYTIQISKNGAAEVPDFEFRILGKQNVHGVQSTSANNVDSNLYLGKISDGKFYLTRNGGQLETEIATITEQITTIRLVVDFETGEIRAYDDANTVIAKSTFTPSAKSEATNTLEYKKCFSPYVFYARHTGGDGGDGKSIRIHSIRAEESDVFTKVQTEGIKYNLNGGTLPEDAPKDFNSDGTPTLLPTDVVKNGYVFGGWYTSPTFESETATTAAPAGFDGLYEVFAKWYEIFVDEDLPDTDIIDRHETVFVPFGN